MQRKTYRANSRKNPWRNTWKDKSKKKINVHRLVSLVLLLSIPLFCLGISSGVLSRAADVYQYNLKASQAVSMAEAEMLQSAVTRAPGTRSISRSNVSPRAPRPTMPTRTTGNGSHFMPRTEHCPSAR